MLYTTKSWADVFGGDGVANMLTIHVMHHGRNVETIDAKELR